MPASELAARPAAFLLAAVAASFFASPATPAGLQGQQVVSRISPADAVSAAEVSIAINPLNIDSIVAGCLVRGVPGQQEPNSSFYSLDGGRTWSNVPVPNPDRRSQGDDVLLFSGDGTCVHGFISFAGLWEENPDRAASGISIVRSRDLGRTWSLPTSVVDHLNTRSPMEDKPWLVYDRHRRSPHFGSLYCSWTRFDVYGSRDPQDSSQIMFARSLDDGGSFGPAIRISDAGGDCADDDGTVEGAVPAVGPDGTVYVVWAGPRGLEMDSSSDGGRTFGRDRVIGEMPGGWSSEVEGISRHNGMPVTGVDHSQGPHRGALYVNWIDERNGDKDVFLVRSSDGGGTWSAPVRVNSDPPGNGRDQFFTWMAVDSVDGSVNIVYYDRAGREGTSTGLTLARSLDGETFQSIPIDFPAFECRKGTFFGDYIGIDAVQGRVAVAFMDFREDGRLGVSASVMDFQPGTMTLLGHGARTAGQAERLTVQHILVGFEGSVPEKEITRTKEESRELARSLLERARAGEDFDSLVREFTNDQHPGIYQMSNLNVLPDMTPDGTADKLFPRGGMVRAFGDVSFSLQVGETGMTEYDPATSKYGWHIIQRIK